MTPFIPASFRETEMPECRKILADAMSNSYRVPVRFREDAKTMRLTKALEQVESVVDRFYECGMLCLLCGPPGTGKSFAAWALACLGYLRHGYDFTGYQSQEFFQMAWHDETKPFYSDAWRGSRTLIVDDIGAEPRSKHGTIDGNLYDGLNYRYSQQLPTILTTNFKAAELAGLYPDFTERLQSRFKEWAVILEIRGNDMRADAEREAQEAKP